MAEENINLGDAENKPEQSEQPDAASEEPVQANPIIQEPAQPEEHQEAVPAENLPVKTEAHQEIKQAALPEQTVSPESVEEIVTGPSGAAEQPAPPEEIVKGERRWYVIQTFTGQEDKVKQAIEQTVEDEGLKSRVFQILVPTEDTIEIKGGKRYEKIRKMFPGYVFLEMILDEKSWYLIRQTTGVARFIGTKVTPTPVSDKEMQRVLKQLGKEERLEVSFERGEGVRVISGPFRGYTGTVDEINAEKGKLKVLINIFGRDTPVEVNFEHAQKIE